MENFSSFVNPGIHIPPRITEITGIDDNMVSSAPVIDKVLKELLDFIGEMPVLGHNVAFDYGFVCQKALNLKMKYQAMCIDTHKISRKLLSGLESRSLENLCNFYGIVEEPRHRAFSDAAAAARLYDCMYEEALSRDNEDYGALFLPENIVYTAKKDSPATSRQISFLKSLIRQHGVVLDKELESLTKSQASREIDKILSTYGRDF
jgi:DNA polymerase-3 subunit epsilon